MKESVAQPIAETEAPQAPATEKTPARLPRGEGYSRNFAAVRVSSEIEEGPINGDDLARLLSHIAGQLGIQTGQLRVRTDDEAQRLTERRNANGLVHNGVAYLKPQVFDPSSRHGRHLLAHEAAHVAQSLLPDAAARNAERAHEAAEAEAETFADSYVATHRGNRVKVALPSSIVAADKDFEALAATVSASRSAEIERIVDLLSYGLFDWAVTDENVFDVLQILAMYPMPVARAIARNIGAKYRGRLFSNLNPPHYSAHREQVLAVCWATENESEFAGEKYQILNFLRLTDLEPLEAVAVDYVLRLSPKVKAAATVDAKRAVRVAEIQEYATSGEATAASKKALEEAHAAEEKEKADRQKKDASLNKLVARIKAKLDEFHVSNSEALELLDAVADQCLPFRDPTDKFRALANGIGTDALDDLISQIPAKGLYQSERRRKAYVYLIATRPAFKNLQVVENLMSSPWWQFWDTVTSEEAFLAYLLVKSMPARARAAFLNARGGQKWKDVLSELPQNIRESATFNFYEGGEAQTDRQALLTQLLDDEIWTAKEKERLDAVLRMARAAGEARFAFDRSKIHRADRVPELKALVQKYELYVEGDRETYSERALKGHAWYQEGLPQRIARMWNYLSLIFGLRNTQLLGEKMAADVDLNDVEDVDRDETKGLRFHDTTGKERKAAYEKGGIPQNVVRVEEYDRGELIVVAQDLLIDQLHLAGATTVTGAPVRCQGLRISVRYAPDDYKVLSLDAGFAELTIQDCAIVSGDAMYSVNSLKFTDVSLKLTNEGLQDTRERDGLGEMFGALLDPDHASGVQLSFTQMRADGVATSSGTYVDWVEVNGLAVRAGSSAESYANALRASAEQLKKRIEEEDAAKVDPQHAQSHLNKLAQLKNQLQKTQAEIKQAKPHGSVIDIRSIKVSGVAGLTEEPIDLVDIHGQGQSVAAVVPLFGDPTSIRNMVLGPDARSTIQGAGKGEEFSIDVGEIRSKKPLRLTGSLPSSDAARKEFDAFVRDNSANRYAESYQPVHDALKQRVEDAAEYETLAARGVQHLSPKQAERYRLLRRKLTAFEERRATIVETLLLQGVSLNASADGNPELIAESLTTTGIKTFTADGRENLHIAEVSGEDVNIGATLKGGLANVKEWRKALESAHVKASKLTLKDIRHAGSGAAIEELLFIGDGKEAKGLEATLTSGEASTGGAGLHVKSHQIIAKGVSVPTHAALLRAELERIDAIRDRDRSKDEVKRREAIVSMLADLERIQKAKRTAEETADATKSAKERAAATKEIAKSDQALQNWQDRLVVLKLTIDDLDITISGLGNVLSEEYNFDRDAANVAITGTRADGQWLKGAEAEGIRTRTAAGDQVLAERIVVGPVSGKLAKTKTGYALEGFKVASLAVRAVSCSSGAVTVQSLGESTLEGIAIDATLDIKEDRKDLTITRLRIEKVVADQLKYEDADKVVTVKSGALLGLELIGMKVGMPDDPDAPKEIEGKVTIDSVQKLALGAVASGYDIDAVLNAAQPAGKEGHALTVNLAKSGETSVTLKGLSGDANVRETGTKNKVHVHWKRLSGTLIKNGDNYTVKDLSIPDLTLSRLDWTVGGKGITIDDKVTLTGIELDLEAALTPKKKKAGSKPPKTPGSEKEGAAEDQEKELSKLFVKRLWVNKIDAKDVGVVIPEVIEDKSKGIEASPKKVFRLEEAIIRGLSITGFDVLKTTGKVEITKSVEINNLHTTIGEVARGQMTSVTTSAKMFGKDADEPGKGGRELSVTLHGKDGTLIRLGRTDSLTLSDLWTYDKTTSKKKGTTVSQTVIDKISLAAITTGDILVKEDSIDVSDIDIAGPVNLTNVSWTSVGAAKQVLASPDVAMPEGLGIKNIRAEFKKVPTGKIVDGKEQTRSELANFAMTDLVVPKIIAKTLSYKGPLTSKKGVKTIDMMMPTATLNGFELKNLSKNFTTNLLNLNATLKSATVDDFTVSLVETIGKTTQTKKFGADVTSGEIRANAMFRTLNAGTPDEETALEDGVFALDSIGLRDITGEFLENGKKTGVISQQSEYLEAGKKPGIDLTGIEHDTKKGTTVANTSMRGLKYHDPAMGLTLKIGEAEVPSTLTVPKKGPVTIPYAKITNTHFKLDDILNAGSGASAGGSSKPIDKEQFWNILDHVNGHFKSNVYVPIYLFDAPLAGPLMLRQDVFTVDMPIKHGKFKYGEVEDKALWLRNDAIVSLQMDTDKVIVGPSGDVVPDMNASYLTLEAFGSNIQEWTPADMKERREMLGGEVSLKRIARPDAGPVKEDTGGREAVDPNQIELRDVDALLNVTGYIPLDLGDTGRIALGTKSDDAVTALKLKSQTTRRLTWELQQMAVTVEELNFGGNKVHGDKPGGAEIHINGVQDGAITFTNGKLLSPKTLEGVITEATVKNLAVDLAEEK